MRKRLLLLACYAVSLGTLNAIDFAGMKTIGPFASFTRSGAGVTITCQDHSQVSIEVLAADLVRVRAAFGKPLPAPEFSWALAKTSWPAPPWTLTEQADALQLSTAELEVVVHHSPLLVEFRDPKNHRTINTDERPLLYDPAGPRIGAAKRLGFEEHFYGLGEKAARLDRRRGEFTMWNTDAYAYKEGTDPIYQSIPFYLGLENGAAYGLFYDNSYRTTFDFGHATQEYAGYTAEGGELVYYFFWGPSVKKVLGRYADLTGHMPLPPRWALGHQQSRYSYYPDTMVQQVADRYRADNLPLEAIHLDIHYMNGYRSFTFDPKRFPDPLGLAERLGKQGVKLVTIVDPGIKYQVPEAGAHDAAHHQELAPQDKSYYVFNQGKAGDYFLKRKDGRLYQGKVWPGDAVFVDYANDRAAQWWGGLFRAYTDNKIAGIWMDMNEPSDFIDQTGATQMDVVSRDHGTASPYAKNRNLFALQMARATYEGLTRLRPDERPYLITRAGYAGIQRYSTMWTGDNNATWDALGLSLPMLASVGLSGEPFAGADVGGFVGRSEAELLTRWYEAAFLSPFFRNHAEAVGYDHEPWRFGKPYEDIIRRYLKLRYRLLPFLYTALEEAHRTGVPVFRPLLLNYQDDETTLTIDDEIMAGDDLLLAPVLKPGLTSRLVYLPAGTWFDYWTGEKYKGGQAIRVEAPLESVPLFVRGGAILPLGPEMNWSGEKPLDPLTFEIFPNESGSAFVNLYEDDGISPAYNKGVFRRTKIAFSNNEITVSAPEGTYATPSRKLEFVLHGAARKTVSVTDDGKAQRIAVE